MDLSDFTTALVERTDLVALIAERTTIKKSGGTFTGCCPFHDEKSPSFHIYSDASPQHYHCFGCGAHGDAISFIRETDHLGFMDALEKLAKRAGMEVPRNEQKNEVYDQQKLLYTSMQEAEATYSQLLRNHAQKHYATDYLKKRGVSDEMISLYGLGFAPPERQLLSHEKDAAKLTRLKTLKLVHQKEDGHLFDMFYNRLMFPIRDGRGRPVAFGGRTLGNDKSKYINSSETPIFHKSSELYGLWEARQQSRQLNELIVVEGYLDVIALSQFGIPRAVATLGTATNEDNLNHLLKVSSDLVFCFDGDKAGLAAADKAMQKVLPLYQAGHQIRFLILPDGEDPDTFVRRNGKLAFEEKLANAAPLSQYFFDALSRDLDTEVPEQRMLLRKRAKDILATLKSSPIYQPLNELTFERTRSPIWANREASKNGYQKKAASSQQVNIGSQVKGWTSLMIALQCVADPAWAKNAEFLLEEQINEPEASRMQELLRWIKDEKIQNREMLFLKMATEAQARVRFSQLFRTLPLIPDGDVLASEAEDALRKMRVIALESRFDRLNIQLNENPGAPGLKEQLNNLMKEKQALQHTPS